MTQSVKEVQVERIRELSLKLLGYAENLGYSLQETATAVNIIYLVLKAELAKQRGAEAIQRLSEAETRLFAGIVFRDDEVGF